MSVVVGISVLCGLAIVLWMSVSFVMMVRQGRRQRRFDREHGIPVSYEDIG